MYVCNELSRADQKVGGCQGPGYTFYPRIFQTSRHGSGERRPSPINTCFRVPDSMEHNMQQLRWKRTSRPDFARYDTTAHNKC